MKRLLPAAILLLIFTGCVTRHYHRLDAAVVEFYLEKPGASTVAFASSLDGFQIHPLKKPDGPAWKITLPADHEFSYFYIVDGQVYLPDCALKEQDDFGSVNCVFSPRL